MHAGDTELELPKPKQWEQLSIVPIFAGLFWLLVHSGGHWLIWALIPGCLLLSTGIALLCMPGDPRITGYMALASVIGVLLSPFIVIAAGFGTALLTALVSMASYLVAGRVGLMREPLYKDAVAPEMSTKLDAKAALDEAILGYFVASAHVPSGDQAAAMCDNVHKLQDAFKVRGWDQDPFGFHPLPPAPGKTWVERGRIRGFDYDVLRFDSAYNPDDALPGATLWKSHTRNSICEVRILRHAGPPRPWLLCIHGYRMGSALLDFSLFSPEWLHERLGLNIIQPVLPLHGSRKIGPRSGDHFLDWDLLDLVYAEGQCLWDLRRTLAWLRSQEPKARVGVMGFSLGGYNASLLAAYEQNLDFVIAAIPVIDLARALWRYMPPAHQDYMAANGLDEEHYRGVLKIVSPLAVPPKLDKERLLILAGTGDRLVVPSHPLQLSRHWGVPVAWYQGAHLTVRRERETRETLNEAMLRSGWLVG